MMHSSYSILGAINTLHNIDNTIVNNHSILLFRIPNDRTQIDKLYQWWLDWNMIGNSTLSSTNESIIDLSVKKWFFTATTIIKNTTINNIDPYEWVAYPLLDLLYSIPYESFVYMKLEYNVSHDDLLQLLGKFPKNVKCFTIPPGENSHPIINMNNNHEQNNNTSLSQELYNLFDEISWQKQLSQDNKLHYISVFPIHQLSMNNIINPLPPRTIQYNIWSSIQTSLSTTDPETNENKPTISMLPNSTNLQPSTLEQTSTISSSSTHSVIIGINSTTSTSSSSSTDLLLASNIPTPNNNPNNKNRLSSLLRRPANSSMIDLSALTDTARAVKIRHTNSNTDVSASSSASSTVKSNTSDSLPVPSLLSISQTKFMFPPNPSPSTNITSSIIYCRDRKSVV